ncbi:hypothetical protein IMG5_182440 [Ichthyophthirius multifiliis]|uniref:Transmembrane protein n=1 Tax=Ichthyophthirius multifiliis TaxID=5932 RepID=G0R319_ICHMU|nr:hypothetical protein IMG5_182440 [Ichthyophthirius multifiliis]EGR28136.1 hypothetical protein IMG5_182440 [Ichthyophthirius multifiliis]|eukprot:XP_004027481.1 hypothetical protein IMG5_182440 [Ichthyophthirius multifiliis]
MNQQFQQFQVQSLVFCQKLYQINKQNLILKYFFTLFFLQQYLLVDLMPERLCFFSIFLLFYFTEQLVLYQNFLQFPLQQFSFYNLAFFFGKKQYQYI